MANFSPIFQSTLGWEGGYQDYSSDSANYTSSGNLVGTNRGISAIAYEQYLGREPSINEMKAITPEISEKVYRKLFWNKMRGDDIKDQDVASIIFATLIGNPAQSNKIVATALKNSGNDVGSVKLTYNDNVVKAINQSNPKKLFYAIKEEKRKFIMSLSGSHPEFINGWMRKVNSFEYGGSKKKWIIISSVIVLTGILGYWAHKRGYHKLLINKI